MKNKITSGSKYRVNRAKSAKTQDIINRLWDEYGGEIFIKLIEENNVELATQCIEAGLEISSERNCKTPFLHRAVECRAREAAIKLISLGIDLKTEDSDGYTPLEVAVFNDNIEICELLLDMNKSLIEYANTRYILSQAVSLGNSEIIKLLISHGANINERYKEGRTPLMIAVGYNCIKPDIVRLLIENSANVNAKDKKGRTPLHSIFDGHNALEKVELLLLHGANIDARDKYGRTPLLRAINVFQFGTALLLVKHGANLRIKDNDGNTPLDIAIKNNCNDLELLRLLKGNNIRKSEI